MIAKKPQQIRIIGGNWRGRKLSVPDLPGLRPTPDRVRETLFNWLDAYCPGARVLDCCAGTGALGFEALSRRARHLTMIESDSLAWQNLGQQALRLEADALELLQGDVIELLPGLTQPYDLVFIDPPYAQPELRAQLLTLLQQYGLLQQPALIYLEWPHSESFELGSENLAWVKRKKAGRVNYGIAEWRLSR